MIDKQLLKILRCPQDQSKLSPADDQLVIQINRAIDGNHLVSAAGHPIKKHLEGGLIRESGDLLYPIFDQIPVMLPDEAIDLAKFQNL